MKTLLKIIPLLTMAALLSACSFSVTMNTPQPTQTGPDILPSNSQAIWFNRIEFVTIPFDALPDAVRQWAEEKSHGTQRYAGCMNDGGYTYILAALGEQPSGGYGVEILSITDAEVGRYTVTIRTDKPDPDSQVTTAITYPAVVVRIDETNIPLDFVGTDGSDFMY